MRKTNLLFIIIALCNYSCNSQINDNNLLIAKGTIQKIFKYSLNDNFDSLRILAPSVVLKNTTNDALKIRFKDFKNIAAIEGVPSVEKLLSQQGKQEPILYSIKFIPKNSAKVGVDSITFNFNKYLGVGEVWTFEVSEAFKDLKIKM